MNLEKKSLRKKNCHIHLYSKDAIKNILDIHNTHNKSIYNLSQRNLKRFSQQLNCSIIILDRNFKVLFDSDNNIIFENVILNQYKSLPKYLTKDEINQNPKLISHYLNKKIYRRNLENHMIEMIKKDNAKGYLIISE
jgi:hypothetical protein